MRIINSKHFIIDILNPKRVFILLGFYYNIIKYNDEKENELGLTICNIRISLIWEYDYEESEMKINLYSDDNLGV